LTIASVLNDDFSAFNESVKKQINILLIAREEYAILFDPSLPIDEAFENYLEEIVD